MIYKIGTFDVVKHLIIDGHSMGATLLRRSVYSTGRRFYVNVGKGKEEVAKSAVDGIFIWRMKR